MTDDWDPTADLTPVQVPVEPTGHALVFVCRFPGCGRRFQLKGNLKRHQNIHLGDKQFHCDYCGRSFLRKADMEVHQRVHTGEKPYACQHPGCDKRFARRSDLLSHERTHSGNKPFACEFPGCGRRFSRRFDLHKHERSHDSNPAKKNVTMKRRLVSSPPSKTPLDKQDDGNDELTGNEKCAKMKASPQRLSLMAAPCATTIGTAPISPTDHANGPGKELHFELKCTEDHVHTSPECFSIEDLDALLGTSAPATACCPVHIQNITEAFATTQGPGLLFGSFQQSMSIVSPTLRADVSERISIHPVGNMMPVVEGETLNRPNQPNGLMEDKSQTRSISLPMALSTSPVRSTTDAMTAQLSMTSLNPPCPVAAKAKLHDYSAHTSCGHLAIQHGDHRDFVVKNHLVCVDSVKSLTGDCGGAHANACVKTKLPLQQPATKCAPQDPHRPGCGHLAVRHGDHIDYVVEDNLFCQLAGGLMEEAGNIELLDDDFWDFYGAIGSLKTE